MPSHQAAAAGTGNGVLHEMAELCDPALHSLEEAIALTRARMEQNRFLDAQLVRWLVHLSQTDTAHRLAARAIRALDILAAVADSARIMPYLVQLLRTLNPNLRSKAVLVVGRCTRNARWAEQRLNEADPRVRANAVESLWGIDSMRARALLWAAVGDSNNRVSGNAMLGLYLLGETGCIPLLLGMAAHQSAPFRATAAWVMGEARDPRFVPVLAQTVSDPDSIVRRNVFRALLEIKRRVAAVRAAGRLEVCIGSVTRTPDRLRHISVTVTPRTGLELAGRLSPTSFVISEDSRIAANYQFERDARPDNLVIGIGLPCGPACEFSRRVRHTLLECLERKRRSDIWAVVRYPEGSDDEGADDEGLPGIRPGSRAARRSTDPDVLRRELLDLQSSMATGSGALSALRILMREVTEVTAVRHIILLAESAPARNGSAPAAIAEAIRLAAASGVIVHTLVPEGSAASAWAGQLSRETRGSSFVVSGENETATACRRIYSGLLNSYELVYHSELPEEPANGPQIHVEVYCEEGYGETRWP